MNIKTFYFNPYRECTYVISGNDAAIIIDPGMYGEEEFERFNAYLAKNSFHPVIVLVTHTHPDHICGIEMLCQHYPTIPVIGKSFSMAEEIIFPQSADGYLENVAWSGPIYVIHTPGHKQDSVCYYFPHDKVLFTGDTLFFESVGRTDLPEGDLDTLMQSLKKLTTLDTYLIDSEQEHIDASEIVIYPGHGYDTTLSHEIAENPFLASFSRVSQQR